MIYVNRIKLERIRLDIPRFAEILSGLKFVHLSDLHISRFGPREKRLVQLVNQENPDLIFITGDLVVNYKNDFVGCIQTLRQLRVKYGLFAVFGNAEHTFQPRHHMDDFEADLMGIPMSILNNKNVELKFNGRSLYLVGVDDPFFQFDNFDKAILGIPPRAPTLLLAHSPDIIFPRADALVISLLDSPFKKDHFKEWGWIDRTQFSPENGDVYFQNDGVHTIRVQSRQDGVALDTILLNPYPEIDGILEKKNIEKINQILRAKDKHVLYPDLVVIPASEIIEDKMFGKWKKEYDHSALFQCRLDDMPAQNKVSFQPLVNPEDYFEAQLLAKRKMKYHVWIRMKAHKGSPLHDSVYLQFSDSVDNEKKERYRIGKPAYSKERMNDVDLILTGHTHGGQIRIPFMGPFATMASLGSKYVSGMYQVGKSKLYVSRGVGCSVLPFRLFCPPEVTVFEFS